MFGLLWLGLGGVFREKSGQSWSDPMGEVLRKLFHFAHRSWQPRGNLRACSGQNGK